MPRTRPAAPPDLADPYAAWRRRRAHYRDPAVAARYDERRFRGPFRARRNRRKWRTVCRALDAVRRRAGPDALRTVLDLPCGTGRFTAHLGSVAGAVAGCDLSRPMIERARTKLGRIGGLLGWVQADAEELPFRDDAADCVVCVRFAFHLPPDVRVGVLAEMARVAPRVVVDVRHRYAYRWVRWRLLRALRLTRRPLERVSRRQLRAEFRAAGLAVREIFPVARFFSDKWIVVGERATRFAPGDRIALGRLGDARVLERLGHGGRSTVYAVEWRRREAVLKAYAEEAVRRHARKHPLALAEFAHRRNVAFHTAPGMARYVAEPLGYVQEDGLSATLQEHLRGELYYFYHRRRGGDVPPELSRELERMVERAHAAGLFDLDLHAMNVIVEERDGRPIPRLFDFNLIPFTERAPNPVMGLLLRLGLMTPRGRDLRKLRRLDDFRRVERKLFPALTRPRGGPPGTPPGGPPRSRPASCGASPPSAAPRASASG